MVANYLFKLKTIIMNVTFDSNHDNPVDSQLLIAITGSPERIRERLVQIIRDIDSIYGKPAQCTTLGYGVTVSVTTPIWDGLKY